MVSLESSAASCLSTVAVPSVLLSSTAMMNVTQGGNPRMTAAISFSTLKQGTTTARTSRRTTSRGTLE